MVLTSFKLKFSEFGILDSSYKVGILLGLVSLRIIIFVGGNNRL